MRLKLLKLLTILLLAGSSESRPQNFAPLEGGRPEVDGNGWKPIPMKSEGVSQTVLSNSRIRTSDSQRELKDLQYMDQSLRTVATQLLNVTKPEEVLKNEEKQQAGDVLTKLIFVEPPTKDLEGTQDISTIVKTIDSLNFESNSSKPIPHERPVNSKFGYLESSYPGQAMAMTEEELEKELNLMRHPTQKIQPTTTGGISTWILLNPPSTTTDLPLEDEEKTKYPFASDAQVIIKTTSSVQKVDSNDQKQVAATIEKVTTQSTVAFEKINTQVPKKSTPSLIRKSTTPASLKPEKLSTKTEKSTQQPDKTTQTPEKSTQAKKVEKHSTTPKNITPKSTTPMLASSIETRESEPVTPKTVTTTKRIQPTTRTTAKPKTTSQAPNTKNSTTVKTSTTKAPKSNPQNKPKTTPQRKTTPKPESQKVENSPTPRIEKVTFRPVQMITTQSSQLEETEVPMFITKIKASVFTETKKTTPLATTTSKTTTKPTQKKSNPIKEDLVEVSVKSKPTGNKANNVLNIQLKKPVDDLTKIEIEPIKVNAPILKIEKIEKEVKKDSKIQDSKTEQDLLNNSRIDLKFDFNPELTRIDVETPDKISTTTAKTISKRRQTSNKRKKNKNRRKKPSSTTSDSTDSEMSALSTIAELFNISDSNNTDNAIQESKIEPETKVATNSTKNKKKQVQKPISTQIYNFLSREVMPSFGVMSLVGLGLGLASYFLYPFGGSIARRNYELEPNYKYNLDEYGGNYGQNEEEVFSKVLQGMTKHDSKYGGIKEYDNNYYKYQQFDGPYSTTTKKTDQRHSTSSSRPIYKPLQNSYDVSYRNTEFKYPDLPTTPNYYESQKQTDFSAGKEVSGNRQFVVGSVPKEYSQKEKVPSLTTVSKRADYENIDGPTKFEREMAQNFNFPKNSVNIPQAYVQAETQTGKNEDVYEEIEITPAAVAVEHGPRLMRIRRSDLGRLKRETVIQVIPSKSEIEKEHREEEIPLSNEILDIIDSAIPGAEENVKDKTKEKTKEKIKEEDVKAQKKRQEEEKSISIKDKILHPESTTKTISSSAETVTSFSTLSTSLKSFTTADVKTDSSKTESSKTESSKTESSKTETTTSSWSTTKGNFHFNIKTAGETTEDWFNDLTTAKPKAPEAESYNIFSIIRKVAEVKIKLGLTLLKHASEGFARYLGHVQKRFNGEE